MGWGFDVSLNSFKCSNNKCIGCFRNSYIYAFSSDFFQCPYVRTAQLQNRTVVVLLLRIVKLHSIERIKPALVWRPYQLRIYIYLCVFANNFAELTWMMPTHTYTYISVVYIDTFGCIWSVHNNYLNGFW